MNIEYLRLKNFRAFREMELRDIPRLMVVVGANGTGKSTLFSVFSFLREAMMTNVTTALAKLGGNRGFEELRSRNSPGPIEIGLKFRTSKAGPLITYDLAITEKQGRAIVEREILKYRRKKNYGKPWHFLDFSGGSGTAITNELDTVHNETELERRQETLKSPDLLAIKGLAQFKSFPAVVALGDLIERWHISDFHISKARPEQEPGYAEHLSREGDNLSLVIDYLHKNHRSVFNTIIAKLRKRVPGITGVESKIADYGRVLLKFQDGSFQEPFLARYVSDGTIKMLAYLVLLHDPNPHPLLCIEEPENQLYPSLLMELAEEFRDYAMRGGQVFVSTHSPFFLNATTLNEVFWIQKKDGYSHISRASDNAQLKAFVQAGDQPGWLWNQGLFEGANP
jgi:predicted ATPase